ncbi:MAG: carbon storage regulator [Pseudomonadota bacterium]
MLYLTRRPGEAVYINNAIEVRVVEVRGRSVKLGFNFPEGASVLREEVFLEIQAENAAAARDAQQMLKGLGGDLGSQELQKQNEQEDSDLS